MVRSRPPAPDHGRPSWRRDWGSARLAGDIGSSSTSGTPAAPRRTARTRASAVFLPLLLYSAAYSGNGIKPMAAEGPAAQDAADGQTNSTNAIFRNGLAGILAARWVKAAGAAKEGGLNRFVGINDGDEYDHQH